MAVLFATLGFTPQLALAPLRSTSTFEAVHVFYGPDHADSAKAFKSVKTACDVVGIKLAGHTVNDPFDYTAFLDAFTKAANKLPGKEITMNASGGTRVGIMAATIFCFTNGIPLLYYDEYSTSEGQLIPLKAFRNLDRLGDTPKAILRLLQQDGPADMGTLASELKLAPSTLTEHVQTLSQSGTVVIEREGKRRVVRLLPDLAKVDLEATR